MSQDKDDPAKTPGSNPAGSGTSKPGQPGDVAKRPYATLDLKATDVTASKPDVKVEAAKVDPLKPEPAKPEVRTAAAPGAATGPGKPSVGTGGSAPRAPGETVKPASTARPGAVGNTGPTVKPAAKAGGSGAWLPSLIAGAAGAVLALLGLGATGLIGGEAGLRDVALRLAALERAGGTSQPGDLAQQLAAAQARLAAVEATARDLAAQNTELAANAKALGDRLASQQPVVVAANERVDKLSRQLEDLSAAAATDPQKGRIPALAGITAKLGELDTQLTTRTASLKTEVSQDLEKSLAVAAATAEAARARLAQRTQSLEQTLKSVGDESSALRSTVDGLKADMEARFKTTAKPSDVSAALAPVAAKVDGLSKDLASVVRSEQERNATAGNVLLALELGNLKRAIDRGGNYATELTAVKKASGGRLDLAVLDREQSSGLPSLAALTKDFSPLAYKMLDADADPTEGSVLDRMLAGAKSIVRVRKVVHSADDTGTEATIGRMESALKDGRLGEVLDEAKKLGPKPQATVRPWLDKVEARHRVETALADLDQSLKTALSDTQKGAN